MYCEINSGENGLNHVHKQQHQQYYLKPLTQPGGKCLLNCHIFLFFFTVFICEALLFLSYSGASVWSTYSIGTDECHLVSMNQTEAHTI